MSNRTEKFVSVVFASFLASTPVSMISDNAARAADDCLTSPKKDQMPEGSHWYYRIDHATKRHCWYLGEERGKLSQTSSVSPAKPTPPKTETATQRTIANARAELPTPQTRVEQQTSVFTGQRTSAAADASATNIDNSQPANATDANTQPSVINKQPSVIASRWPDSGLASSTSPEPTTVTSDTTATSDTDVQAGSEDSPPSVADAVPLAAADSSPASQGSIPASQGSIQMLLLVIVGALGLAGVMGATVFRFGRMRRAGRREIGGDRRAIWDSVDIDRPSPLVNTRRNLPTRRVDVPREPAKTDNQSDRIAEMLAQLRRSAAN